MPKITPAIESEPCEPFNHRVRPALALRVVLRLRTSRPPHLPERNVSLSGANELARPRWAHRLWMTSLAFGCMVRLVPRLTELIARQSLSVSRARRDPIDRLASRLRATRRLPIDANPCREPIDSL